MFPKDRQHHGVGGIGHFGYPSLNLRILSISIVDQMEICTIHGSLTIPEVEGFSD